MLLDCRTVGSKNKQKRFQKNFLRNEHDYDEYFNYTLPG